MPYFLWVPQILKRGIIIKKLAQGGTSMAKVITYECDQCGCEVVVTSTAETDMMPIYCCGLEVKEVTLAGKKAVGPKKTAKKSVKKEVAKKKKPAVKKKAARKS
jgi:hypothetical protein